MEVTQHLINVDHKIVASLVPHLSGSSSVLCEGPVSFLSKCPSPQMHTSHKHVPSSRCHRALLIERPAEHYPTEIKDQHKNRVTTQAPETDRRTF